MVAVTIRILNGDCREMLAKIADRSVQCCVTSPPYYGLRNYGVDGQIGLEPSPESYVTELVSVFREVRRVLRDDGVLFLNLGDSYARSQDTNVPQTKNPLCVPPQTNHSPVSRVGSSDGVVGRADRPGSRTTGGGLKPKDLIGIPWMIAFALRADGWYLRSDIIWAKPNPMPESVTDRPTSAHEHVFLFAKSGDHLFWTHRDKVGSRVHPEPDYRWKHRETKEEICVEPHGLPEDVKRIWQRVNLWSGHDYFWDAEAVRQPMAVASIVRLAQDVDHRTGSSRANGGAKTNGPMKAVGGLDKQRGHGRRHDGFNDRWDLMSKDEQQSMGANCRNVWTIATQPFSESHFATFPPDLAERCIKAGTSERGCCASCGAPWARITIKGEPDMPHRAVSGADASGGYSGQSTKNHDATGVQNASDVKRRILEGMREKAYSWAPTCECHAGVVPCTVLDPFAGAFTTCMVADRMQRHAIGVELNPEYCEMAERRIVEDAGMFADLTE